MSLNPRGNPAGKIEIVIPVSPIEGDGEKRLMKVDLVDLLASIPATNGALSAGVALLLKAVFTFGGRDDLDASANETIEDAVDMVLAGIAMYEPGEVAAMGDASAAAPENYADSNVSCDYFSFGRYLVPKPRSVKPGSTGPEIFEPRRLPPDETTSKTDVRVGLASTTSGRWVLTSAESNCLFCGLPEWAEMQVATLATNLNAKLAADAGVE